MKYLVAILFTLSSAVAFSNQLPVDTTASQLSWLGGKKFATGEHDGQVTIKEGFVTVKGDAITGGQFTIDMKSITNNDLQNKSYNKKLVNHLKSDDFFAVGTHPTATFKITKVTPKGKNQHEVMGELTIRGKTHPETFTATIMKTKGGMKAKGTITFDRLKYGVTYNADANIFSKAIKVAKDKIIKEEIKLTFDLKTKPKS